MQFVKISDLKSGMRLARPIYNKNGVLLFDRDSKINDAGIASIANFGLIGLFILEPAEPCPPMSPEDIEFERFQTVNVFSLMDEVAKIKTTGKSAKINFIVDNILKSYGHLDTKINFNQNLRSETDASFKHALNVAILAAMMSNKLNIRLEERTDTVMSSLLRGNLPVDVVEKQFSSSPNIKRYMTQAEHLEEGAKNGALEGNVKIMMGGKILAVASTYDNLTSMGMDKEPESELSAIKYMMDRPEFFDKEVVMSLIDSINILVPGICVELNTGAKALVIGENRTDFFRPMVLCFNNNEIMDLANKSMYGDLEIVDIMKTMDNRHVIDTSMLNN